MKKERFASKYRTWIQAAWFALTNGYLRGYATGKIYTSNTKVLCVPGLNCYSCPGAMGACPIGSLQAVLGFYSPLNLSFRGTYDSLRTATVQLMSFAKSLVAVYMILTGIRLFLNRNDANAACRVKEATGLALKFYLFCVVLFIIASVINIYIFAYCLSPMLVSFFTPLGLPILHAYAKQLDRIIRGEKKPGFVWYLTAIITVLLSLAGVGILFVGALIK